MTEIWSNLIIKGRALKFIILWFARICIYRVASTCGYRDRIYNPSLPLSLAIIICSCNYLRCGWNSSRMKSSIFSAGTYLPRAIHPSIHVHRCAGSDVSLTSCTGCLPTSNYTYECVMPRVMQGLRSWAADGEHRRQFLIILLTT